MTIGLFRTESQIGNVVSANTNNDSNTNKWYTGGVVGFIILLVGNNT